MLWTSLVLCALPPADCRAQDGRPFALDPAKVPSQYQLRAWTAEDGLPMNSVVSIVQTRDGYLWFGTEEGLVRFDGIRFTVFDPRNTPAMRNAEVVALHEAADGILWVGTMGGGALRVSNGSITALTARDGLASDFVTAIAGHTDGSIWIGTSGGGLSRVSGGSVQTFGRAAGLPNPFVQALLEDRQGNLWVGTRAGLARFKDGVFVTYTTRDGLSEDYVYALHEDRAGTLWIGTNGGGLNRLRAGRFTAYSPRDGLTSDQVLAVLEDSKGNLWVGTNGGGLCRFRNGRCESLTTRDGLLSNLIWSLLEDREGNLWIGAKGGGLHRLRDTRFTAYGVPEGLSTDIVLALYEDRRGALWLGTAGGGVNRFAAGRFTTYTMAHGLPSDLVLAIQEDRDGALWLGTPAGLTRLRAGTLRSYTKRDGLPSNVVQALAADRQGNLWIGTSAGLARFRDGRVSRYAATADLGDTPITALLVSATGGLWIGTEGRGIAHLADGKLTAYSAGQGLSSDAVLALYEDAEGVLWVGTRGGGLNRFAGGRFTAYTTKTGLFDDAVYVILEDAAGTLWMCSNRGIFTVRRDELTAFAAGRIRAITSTSYGPSDGMRSRECNGGVQPAGVRRRDGTLWFPTLKGAVAVNPARLRPDTLRPPVRIEHLRVDERELAIDAGEVRLPAGSNRLEIDYTALSLGVPERVTFRYRLDGHDHQWIDAGTRRTAYYTSIGPGRYQFRVIAANGDGFWNETGTGLSFALAPYLYQRRTVQAVLALLVAAVGVLLFRRHVRRLRVRERELLALIEERARAQEALRASEQQLAQSQKMEAVGRLAGGIAHDFNNLLTAVMGNAEILAVDLPADEPGRGEVQEILSAAQRAAALTRQLLAFSRRQVIEPRVLDLNAVVADVEKMLRRVIGEDIDLASALQPEIDRVRADPGQVEQVLMNLAVNARDAMPEGGRLTIETANVHLDAEYARTHFPAVPGDYVMLAVSDTGVGMTADVKARVFEPFFTTKEPGKGTGLGLATVYGIVKQSDGYIWVYSEPNHGTTFKIYLPRVNAPAEPLLRRAESNNVPTGTETVLLVEDEQSLRELAVRILRRQGYTVLDAGTGEEALELLRTSERAIDLLLTDVVMPRMSGRQLAEQARALRPHLPVLFMSGYAERASSRHDFVGPDAALLQKPFTPGALARKVREALDHREPLV